VWGRFCASVGLTLGYAATRTVLDVVEEKTLIALAKNQAPVIQRSDCNTEKLVRNLILLQAKHPHSEGFRCQNRKQLLLLQHGSCDWKNSGQDEVLVLACAVIM
jgi:hypothetical protein